MLVVDDHTLLTGGIVGTHVLLDTPVTPPPTQYATTAAANRKWRLESGTAAIVRENNTGSAVRKRERKENDSQYVQTEQSMDVPSEPQQGVNDRADESWVTYGVLPDSCFTAVQS